MPTLTLKTSAPHDRERDQALATALLEISVTEGSNTAAQKAAFAELRDRLAPGAALEEAS
jgi:hypothetical protein